MLYLAGGLAVSGWNWLRALHDHRSFQCPDFHSDLIDWQESATFGLKHTVRRHYVYQTGCYNFKGTRSRPDRLHTCMSSHDVLRVGVGVKINPPKMHVLRSVFEMIYSGTLKLLLYLVS
jgi:hypothetical protein